MRTQNVKLLFLVSVLVRCSADFLTDLEHMRSCNKTFPISLAVLNGVLVNQTPPKEEESNFRCFVYCLFAKYGWMDEDGGFLLHKIKESLVEVRVPQLETILYRCTGVDSSDKCERAFDFMRCFWETQQTNDDQLLYKIVED